MKMSLKHCLFENWCYLYGNEKAENCFNATKSTAGNYYWTRDADLCNKLIAANATAQIRTSPSKWDAIDLIVILLISYYHHLC